MKRCRMPAATFLLLSSIWFFVSGCSDPVTYTSVGNSAKTVTTTLAGLVTDESGEPIPGVTVTAQGAPAAVTNSMGYFAIENVAVPAARCVVIARKAGYFTGARAATPKAGNVTLLPIGMMPATTTGTVDASTGGSVEKEGARVEIPAGGVTDENGAPYSGTVNVALRYLDPAAPLFPLYFSGDIAATRADGSSTGLYSYGVIRCELSSSAGAPLHLAPGARATLTYPVPEAAGAAAPATVPLWYFDEVSGRWKEEGSVTRSGSVYTGSVSHFTDWNCDMPANMGVIKGRVVCAGDPAHGIPSVEVMVGQLSVVTDEDGIFVKVAPVGVPIKVVVHGSRNMGLSGEKILDPIAVGQIYNMGDIAVDPRPGYITGTLVDDNGEPTSGFITGQSSAGAITVFVRAGTFRIAVKEDRPLTVKTASIVCSSDAVIQTSVPSGETRDLGKIGACSAVPIEPRIDIAMAMTEAAAGDHALALSPDGLRVAVGGSHVKNGMSVEVHDTRSGALLSSINAGPDVKRLQFSDDGARLMTVTGELPWGKPAVWDVASGSRVDRLQGYTSGFLLPDGRSALVNIDTHGKFGRVAVNTGQIEVQYEEANTYVQAMAAGGTRAIIAWNNGGEAMATWDMNLGKKVASWVVSDSGTAQDIVTSGDGSLLGVRDIQWYSPYLYNTVTGAQILMRIPVAVGAYAIAPDNVTMVTARSLYDIETGRPSMALKTPPGGAGYAGFAFSDNGDYLAATYHGSSGGSKLRIFKLR